MSIYCISDIHGYFYEFLKMLSIISFQESDELYILGDIIDRGPQSAEMLWYATEEAPKNIHFLLGNHEDMMLAAANNYYNRDRIELRLHDAWAYNDGSKTLEQIEHFEKYYDGWEAAILDWIDGLPLYYVVTVNGRKFVLVHAGLQHENWYPDDSCFDGKSFELDVEGFPQNSQAMLWNRTSWLFDKFKWPFDVVCGHTPVVSINKDIFDEYGLDYKQNIKDGIFHFGTDRRKHLIDCGVNRGNKLGCLRLDDMKEFYVDYGDI